MDPSEYDKLIARAKNISGSTNLLNGYDLSGDVKAAWLVIAELAQMIADLDHRIWKMENHGEE